MNNKKVLRIVAEFGNESKRALLIELPQQAIEGLNIAKDGTVETTDFITMLQEHYSDDGVDWMKMIFSTPPAGEPKGIGDQAS